jgi:hypothetical protein
MIGAGLKRLSWNAKKAEPPHDYILQNERYYAYCSLKNSHYKPPCPFLTLQIYDEEVEDSLYGHKGRAKSRKK